MINLKNEFKNFKSNFESYKLIFKNYEEHHAKSLKMLREHTGREDSLWTKDIKPTDKYIIQAGKLFEINSQRYLAYEAVITKIDNYMERLEEGENLDKAVDFINQLKSIIDSPLQEEYILPQGDISDSPFVMHAIMSLYMNKLNIDVNFDNLNTQYLQLTEIANETLQMMNEPRVSDCFNVSDNDSMLVEQIAVLDSLNSGSNDGSLFNSFENSSIYGGCDIYLGYQYCV